MKPSGNPAFERPWKAAGVLLAAVVLCCTLSGSAAAERDTAARQLDFANGLFLRKLYDMAAKEYAAYVQAYPGDATEEYARFQWAESLYNLQDYDAAAAAYQQLLEKFPQGGKRAESLLRLGMIAYQQDKYDEAVETLSRLLSEKPQADVTEVARYYLGSSHLARQEHTQARAVFNTQLKEAPGGLFASFAKLNLGTALKQLDNTGEAIRLWREVAESEGDSQEPRFRNLAIEANFRLGETLDELGRHEEAAEAFATLAAQFPDSPLLTSSLYREAWARFSAGKYREARQKAEALLARPGLADLDTVRVGTRFLIGLSQFESKAYDEAIRIFEEVLNLPKALPEWNTYAPKSRYHIVWSHFLKGNNVDTRKQATQFLQEFPEHPLGGDVRFVKGEALFRQQLYQSAREEYLELRSRYPDSQYRPEATFKLGQCEAELLHFDEAAKIFREFQSEFPGHAIVPQATFMEGEALYDGQRYSQAAEVYRRFIQTYSDAPQVEQAFYKLGQCFLQMEEFKKIAETYREMLERFADSAFRSTALFWIAYEADRGKRPEEAMASYETLLQDYPKSQYASEARLRLAMLYYEKEEAQQAADLFRTLIDAPEPPKSMEPSVYFWTGATLAGLGQYENAIAVYQRLVERFPRQDFVEETTYEIANCYYHLQDWARAAEYYEQATREFPEGSFTDRATLGRARVDLQENRPAMAVQRLETILSSPEPAVAAQAGLCLGDAYERTGELDKAIAAYLKVAFLYEHAGLVPEAYWKASQLLIRRGDRLQARQHLEELQKLYPDNPYAAQAEAFLTALAGADQQAAVQSATR